MTTTLRGLALAGVTLAALAVALPGAASAQVTIDSTVPTWGPTTGGTNILYQNVGAGNATVFQVRWGTDGGSGQSGLGFDPLSPPAALIPANTIFKLGDLFHYNNPIGGGSAASDTILNLATSIASGVPTVQNFAFKFFIDETPNGGTCAYPSVTPCADQITFQNITTASSFQVAGVDYTIELAGFSSDNGVTIAPNFISQEGGSNQIGLYGIITAPTPQTDVPEPATMALLGAGLLGLGFARRRRG